MGLVENQLIAEESLNGLNAACCDFLNWMFKGIAADQSVHVSLYRNQRQVVVSSAVALSSYRQSFNVIQGIHSELNQIGGKKSKERLFTTMGHVSWKFKYVRD